MNTNAGWSKDFRYSHTTQQNSFLSLRSEFTHKLGVGTVAKLQQAKD